MLFKLEKKDCSGFDIILKPIITSNNCTTKYQIVTNNRIVDSIPDQISFLGIDYNLESKKITESGYIIANYALDYSE